MSGKIKMERHPVVIVFFSLHEKLVPGSVPYRIMGFGFLELI